MLAFFAPYALKIGAALAAVGAVVALFFSVRHAGVMAERASNLQRAGVIIREQQKAAANRPRTDDQLNGVLERGEF